MHASRAEATAEALVKSTADAGLDFCSVSQLCTGSEMLPLEMPTHHKCWDIFPFCKNKYLLNHMIQSLSMWDLNIEYPTLGEHTLKKRCKMFTDDSRFCIFKLFFIFYRRPQNTSMCRNNKVSQCSAEGELRLFGEYRPWKDLKFKLKQRNVTSLSDF